MNKQKFIERISETEGNESLVNPRPSDDYVPEIILKAINDSIKNDGNVEEDGFVAVISGVIERLQNAMIEANSIRVETSEEPVEYNIEVCRTGYAFATVTVMAKSRAEAVRLALKQAGNMEFSEKDATYETE